MQLLHFLPVADCTGAVPMATNSSAPPAPPASSFEEAFPNSRKIHLDGPRGIRVPMREIALSGGEPPLRVYDTSGPQGHDVNVGLPGAAPALDPASAMWEGRRAGGRSGARLNHH